MPVDRFIPIVIVLGIAMLLVFMGVILALRQRSKGSAAHKAVAGDKPAPEWVKGLAGTAGKALTRTSAANVPADAILVLHDPVSSDWLVEVNGMRYRSLKEIHDDRAAGKVLEALSGLQRFAGTIPIVRPELKPTPASSATSSPTSPAREIEPSVNQAMKQGAVGSSPLYPAPPNSILDQIEKLLQHNLMRYPEFAERRIHVGAASDGTLLIEVDRQFYQHADEVPDPAIRGVIKDSIQEWERSA
jgi:hypothetical protein